MRVILLWDFWISSEPLSQTLKERISRNPKELLRGCLKYLMQEHGLKQEDLTELGPLAVISEILSGRRTLNEDQSKALGKRFGCSQEIFMSEIST